MAVINHDHLSSEVGHSAGFSRIVLSIGLVLIGLGVVSCFVAIGLGMNEARHGVVNSDGSIRLLPIGGASVVVGLLVAAAGMAMARRDAGE